MIIEHNKEKLINAIIYFLQNTQNCKKTKLMKLLYFLDFSHFMETGKNVTGLTYKAYQMGPYPDKLGKSIDRQSRELRDYFNITFDGEIYNIEPKTEFNPEYFSRRELKLLKNIAKEFSSATAQEMIALSHKENQPWFITLKEKGPYSKIDYSLILDKEKEDYSEIIENIKDRKAIEEIFV